jgi:flagellar motor switch protein FliM
MGKTLDQSEIDARHVLALPTSAREPIHLNIAGKPMFLAYPVRQGTRRSAKIERRISVASRNSKEQG